MSQPTTTPSPTAFAARRSVQYLIAVGSIVAVGVLAVVILNRKAPAPPSESPEVDERLRDAIAQLDQTDPHWRFADLVKDRAPAPDDRLNPALIMRAAATLLPGQLKMDSGDARKGLRNGTVKDRKAVGLDAAKAAVEEARMIRPLGRGRHPVEWNLKNPLMTKLPHIRTTIDTVDLLTLDAELRAHEGKMDEALESIQAALVAARTISDEPMMASQYQRPGFHQFCTRALEESLRWGQASRDNLRSVELALLAEADEPWLKFAARGERAGLHGLMNALEHGSINRAEGALLDRRAEGVNLILSRDNRSETAARPERIHAWLLEYTTQFIQILDLPPEQQTPRLKELADSLKEAPKEVLPLLSAFLTTDLVQASHTGHAALRCAAVGMALERYRLATGRWPETLDDLVAKHILTKLPTDPFNGKPLRYERTKEGVVVYPSVPDVKPGTSRFARRDDADPSFRLWNVEARQKPAS